MANRVIAQAQETLEHLGDNSHYWIEIERSAAGPPGLLIDMGFKSGIFESDTYSITIPNGVEFLTPVVEWLNEWEYQDLEVVSRSKTDVRQLKITWQQLVVFRDVALEQNDFERAVGYSHIIEDMATLIKNMGESLPELPR